LQTRALVFDSIFDNYRGVVVFVRVFSGEILKRKKAKFLGTGAEIEILDCGFLRPSFDSQEKISTGEIGFVVTGLKSVRDARIGDTLFLGNFNESVKPLPGFKILKPMLFAGFFPIDTDEFSSLRSALEKLSLSDSSISFEPEFSPALGNGFRIGLLGMLHLEIVQERLEREFNLDLIATAPSVSFQILEKTGKIYQISSATKLPDLSKVDKILEPWVNLEILSPKDFIGKIMEMATSRRGIFKNMQYLEENRVLLNFQLPMSAIVSDWYDRLKSVSSGFASMNYDFLEFRAGDLVKLDILIAGEKVDSLSQMVHRSESRQVGLPICQKLKEIIPRSQFPIAIQAAIGSQIIARETIPALRKDVTAGLYGGDVTRKNKLLKKQKAGKKRMKQIGKISLPQEAFLAILKRD